MLNEALGVWDEARFQNGGRRNYPATFGALQMPDTFLPPISIISETCECSLTNTNTKGFFNL